MWLASPELAHKAPIHEYRVAGLRLCCERPIEVLQSFGGVDSAPDATDLLPFQLAGADATVALRGLIGGKLRSVRAAYRAGACVLSVEGVGRFRLRQLGITFPCSSQAPLSPTCIETLTGPALLLALAARGRFALHASAAEVAGAGLWVFLGDSGAGKSTLAAFAGSAAGCRPVADDILPVSWGADGLRAYPWYPQLKLGPKAQYAGGSMAERLAVAGICVLEPRGPSDEVALVPLTSGESITALTRQTVAARLFAPAMLARHFQAVTQVAGTIPMYRLGIPRDHGRIAEVYRKLAHAGAVRRRWGSPK